MRLPRLQIVEECDAKSPYSYQFIDPTRHTPTYGVPSTHPLAKLCAKLLAGLPEAGATLQEGDAVTLRRGHGKHKGLEVRSGDWQRLGEVVL